MPIPFLSMFVILGWQTTFEGLPTATYVPAVSPGEREIVLGPALQGDVTMEVRFEKDIPAEFTPNKILGPTWTEYSQGYVRWEVKDGALFDKPCRILKTEGITRGTNKTKLKVLEYATRNSTTYWITPEGKLLRQSVTLVDPRETKTAECVFWSDHVEVSTSDKRGRRAFTVYPNIDLSLVDLQFKPMIQDNKIVLPKKEYYAFEPFSQAFLKYTATVAGEFHGTWLGTKFDGTHVDIVGPKGTQTTVYISKEGDLVKVDLPANQALVLNNLPHSKDPLYQKTVGMKQGNGNGPKR